MVAQDFRERKQTDTISRGKRQLLLESVLVPGTFESFSISHVSSSVLSSLLSAEHLDAHVPRVTTRSSFEKTPNSCPFRLRRIPS